uniref:TIL domain-containing protein n=1 Tax=Anopheles merus TaxID=30066 RepID=A0A182V6P7_ANOME
MNWTIVLIVAAGCSICAAQTTVKRYPTGVNATRHGTTGRNATRPGTTGVYVTRHSTTGSSVRPSKGLIPVAPGAKCPITTCGRNEALQACGTCNQITCSGISTEVCRRSCYCGCQCRRGYVRVTKNGPCVLPKQCPRLPAV